MAVLCEHVPHPREILKQVARINIWRVLAACTTIRRCWQEAAASYALRADVASTILRIYQNGAIGACAMRGCAAPTIIGI